MKGSFKLLSVRGINIFVHWTFFLLILWIIFIDVRIGATPVQMMWSVLFVLAVFACVILHELGHALMAARYGIETKKITLLPIGGIASINRLSDEPKQELAIAAAGPAVNVVIAVLLLPFLQPYMPFWEMGDNIGTISGQNFLYMLHTINIFLVLFNLIPAFPMDGGRILRALLGFKFGYARATTIAATAGKIFAGLFILAGIFGFNIFLILIGFFVIAAASSEEYYFRLKAIVKGVRLKEVLTQDYGSLEADQPVNHTVDQLDRNHSKFFMVFENSIPIGIANRNTLIKAITEPGYNGTVRDLMNRDIQYFDGDTQVEAVLDKLSVNPDYFFPVKENDRFIGVVNFSHILEHLLLRKRGVAKNPEQTKPITGFFR